MVEQGKIFASRREAGVEVGRLLEAEYKNENALVLGIPRGGVIVAYEVAKILHGELSVVITKKLPHPAQEELAIGAVAEDGSAYLTSLASSLSDETVNRIIQSQAKEIEYRVQRFRNGEGLPEMTDRVVIIVDDGIATGSTIMPAIKLCKNRKAAKVVVASPVSGVRYVSEINMLADDMFIVEQPENFYAVAQVYQDFHHLSDEEVIVLLQEHGRRDPYSYIQHT